MSQHGLPLPPSPDAISAEWLTAALRSSGAINHAEVSSLTIRPVEAGSGFVGQTARLFIEYDRAEPGAPALLFAKFSSAAPEVREKMRMLGLYETEAGFYRDLAARDNFPMRVPRPYLSLYEAETGASVLLIEDLGHARFCDNVTGSSEQEAVAVVRHLAQLHAHFWNDTELMDLPWMRNLIFDTPMVSAIYGAMLTPWEQRFAGLISPYCLNAAKEFHKVIPRFLHQCSQAPATLYHGDMRLDNVAITSNGHGDEYIFYDWQVARVGRGATDLAYYMVLSLPVEQRRATEAQLLSAYHESLVDNGVTGYSTDHLLRDFRRGLGSPLRTAVIAGGMLDFSSERGQQLLEQLGLRIGAALEDHQFTESFEELYPEVVQA